jgi:hypothetical protein
MSRILELGKIIVTRLMYLECFPDTPWFTQLSIATLRNRHVSFETCRPRLWFLEGSIDLVKDEPK